MDLRRLRYFLAVVEERRFSLAARRLHIAAPSLSQQIRALERELRVVLLDRTPRGVELTPAGRVLVEHARVILAEVDRAREALRSAKYSDRDQIFLRVCTLADPVLDGPLRAIGAAIPGVEVFVTPSPGDDAVEAVRQARADAAVVWSRPQEQRDLDGTVLGTVRFGVILPRAHPFADRTEVPVAALEQESLIMFPPAPFSGVWQRTVDHLLPGGARPGQVVVEPDLINSPEAMVRAVEGGRGIAPGILGVAEHMGVGGVVVRPLDPPLSLELEVVWRRPARPAVRRVLDFLFDAVQDPDTLITPRRRRSGPTRTLRGPIGPPVGSSSAS